MSTRRTIITSLVIAAFLSGCNAEPTNDASTPPTTPASTTTTPDPDEACEALIRRQMLSTVQDWSSYTDNGDGTVTLHTDDNLATAMGALLIPLIEDTPTVCEHLTTNDLTEMFTDVLNAANENLTALICPPCVPPDERW